MRPAARLVDPSRGSTLFGRRGDVRANGIATAVPSSGTAGIVRSISYLGFPDERTRIGKAWLADRNWSGFRAHRTVGVRCRQRGTRC